MCPQRYKAYFRLSAIQICQIAVVLSLLILFSFVEWEKDVTRSVVTSAQERNWETAGLTSSQGHVFRPKKVRTFRGSQIFCDSCHIVENSYEYQGDLCDKWVVMTTIFEPTKLSYQLANLEDWCVVVVGDLKGPRNYSMAGVRKQVVYLDPGTQSQLPYEIIGHLPWNHFSRKNVGYTYAIHHGASIIYDTDDDNVLATDSIPLDQILGSAIRQKLPHAFQKIYI